MTATEGFETKMAIHTEFALDSFCICSNYSSQPTAYGVG